MGWCSGTDIFDAVYEGYVELGFLKEDKLVSALADLIRVLEDNDWDCQSDSKYWNNPLVIKARRDVHPDHLSKEQVEVFTLQDRFDTSKETRGDFERLLDIAQECLSERT